MFVSPHGDVQMSAFWDNMGMWAEHLSALEKGHNQVNSIEFDRMAFLNKCVIKILIKSLLKPHLPNLFRKSMTQT